MQPVFTHFGSIPADLQHFDCGVPELNEFLCRDAKRFVSLGLSSVKLLIDRETGSVIGFYAISPTALRINWISTEQRLRYNVSFPIPAWLIGRLAVGKTYQSMHFGAILLHDAVLNIKKRATGGAGAFIVVDAMDVHVKHFYEHYGFSSLPHPRGLKLVRTLSNG